MGRDFFEQFGPARELFEEADERLGMHLSRIVFEGPQELLRETVNCQLGIYVTSLAMARVVQAQLPELRPAAFAGHSLGEYTALTVSGRLSLSDGLELVKQRGQLMQEACQRRPGTMVAVVGLSLEELERRLQGELGGQGELGDQGQLGRAVWLANLNAPDQVILSGTPEGVAAAGEAIRAAGGAKVVALEVAGAFHSPLMAEAAQGLARLIEAVELTEQALPIVMNRTGHAVVSSAAVRQQMVEQMGAPVQWVETLRTLGSMGTQIWLEIGPGRVVSGLCRRNGVVGKLANVERVEDLDKVAELICQAG